MKSFNECIIIMQQLLKQKPCHQWTRQNIKIITFSAINNTK